MLILKYKNRIFFINELYVDGFIFVSSFLIVTIIKRQMNKRSKTKNRVKNIRGGDKDVAKLVRECMANDGLYHVENPKIVKLAKYVFDHKKKHLIIDLASYVLLHIVNKKVTVIINNHVIQAITISHSHGFGKTKMILFAVAGAIGGLINVAVAGQSAIVALMVFGIVTIIPYHCSKEVTYIPPGTDKSVYIRALPANEERLFVNVKTPSVEERELALRSGLEQGLNLKKTTFEKLLLEDKTKNFYTKFVEKKSPYTIYRPQTLDKKDVVYNKSYNRLHKTKSLYSRFHQTYIEKKFSLSADPHYVIDNTKRFVPVNSQNSRVTKFSEFVRANDSEAMTEFEGLVKKMCPRDRVRVGIGLSSNSLRYADETNEYCE